MGACCSLSPIPRAVACHRRGPLQSTDSNSLIIGQVAGVGLTGMARLLAQAVEGLSFDALCCVVTSAAPCRTRGSHRNCCRDRRLGLWLSRTHSRGVCGKLCSQGRPGLARGHVAAFLASTAGCRGTVCLAWAAGGGQTMATESSSEALTGGTRPWCRAAQGLVGSTPSPAG